MDSVKFLVSGSSEEPYEVLFTYDGNNLNAYCTCPAGSNGMYCKHRFQILKGDSAKIVSPNKDQVASVVKWLDGSDIQEAMKKVEELELETELIKNRLSAAKKKLAKSMRN